MAMKNCIRCGGIMFDMNKVCLPCRQKEEEQCKVVLEFLQHNPGSTIPQISEATKVRESIIMGLIRKGHLVADEITIKCEKCGRDIPATKTMLCSECQAKMDRDVQKVRKDNPVPAPDAPPRKPLKPTPGGGRDDGAFSTVKKTRQ